MQSSVSLVSPLVLESVTSQYRSLWLSFRRKEGAVKTILITSSLSEAPSDNALKLLHPHEKRTADACATQKERSQYLHGRVATKLSLLLMDGRLTQREMSQLIIRKGVFKYPIICGKMNEPYELSISHSSQVVCTLLTQAGHPIGIDILDKYPLKKAYSRVLSENEKQLAPQCHPSSSEPHEPLSFMLMWSVREALSKALHVGFTTAHQVWQIKTLTPHLTLNKLPYYESTFTHFFQLKAYSFPMSGHVLSICLPRNTFFSNVEENVPKIHTLFEGL